MKKNRNQYGNPAATMGYFLIFFFGMMLISFHSAAQAKWAAPQEANDLKNPLAGNNTALKEGKTLYVSYCTPCHGDKGKGDGVAAASLSTKPADHSSDNVQKQTDGALYWMITEGRNPMPTYKQAFSDNQRWELVDYIRTLSRTLAKSTK
jgi:mono/diheme cytochrome c family protein